jgi:cytochrome c oxidase subunit 1
MHFMGILGMPRRIYTYAPQYASWNHVATLGSYMLGIGMLIFFLNMLGSLWKGRRAPVDPWDHAEFTKTLEWTVTSPPPAENFATLPVIR